MAYQQLSKIQHAVEVTLVNEDYTPPSSTLQNYEEIHDFDFSPASPRSTVKSPSIKKHVPHWSSSTNSTAVTSEVCSTKSNNQAGLSRARSWAFESKTYPRINYIQNIY